MSAAVAAASGAGFGGALPYIVGAILAAAFGGGGYAVLRNAGREGSKIIVDAAQGAVIVQSGVIKDLNDQLDEQREQIRELRSHITEITELRAKVGLLETANRVLRREKNALEGRVAELENHKGGTPP